MLIVPTVTGIRTFIGRPSVPHFSISPATCQGQAADAVAALAHARNLRPMALEILCVPRFAHLQKILNTAQVTATITTGENTSTCTRYFITSLQKTDEFAYAVRKHWCIESQLHWSLDVIFREDAARTRKDNSPLNMNVLRKQALALLHAARTGRLSKKK